MNVAIRVDASELIGSGHVMRCLVLADQLKAIGAKISFICADLPGQMDGYINQRGHDVAIISPLETPFEGCGKNNLVDNKNGNYHTINLADKWRDDAEATLTTLFGKLNFGKAELGLLIIDHYSFDKKWESEFRPFVKKIMVIDDRANRSHDCDLLLDQNLHYNMENRYRGLVPDACKTLLGPGFALLRPEFWEARKKLRKRDGIVRRILVFFGGADPTNETAKALEAIKKLNRPDIAVDVVVGTSNPRKQEIENTCRDMPGVILHCQVENMTELMIKADLAIGAGGSTTWERCCVGLPAITIAVAENQLHGSKDKNLAGSQIYLGKNTQINSDDIVLALAKLLNDKEQLLCMANSAYKVMSNYNYHAVIDSIIGLLDEKVR